MICGQNVESVFGGPADIDQYFKSNADNNHIGSLNTGISLSNTEEELNSIYSDIRAIRENESHDLLKLKELSEKLSKNYPEDWLGKLEIYEISFKEKLLWIQELEEFIISKTMEKSDLSNAIKSSLQLIKQ